MTAQSNNFYPGDIWQFPIDGGTDFAFLKVILPVDLLMPDSVSNSPFMFVSGSYLVQVSRLTYLQPNMFDKHNLLVKGMFVAKLGKWSKYNYKKVDKEIVKLDDVEPPCWFAWRSVGKGKEECIFFRGEIGYDGKGLKREEVEKRWGPLLLTLRYPSQLGNCFGAGQVLTPRYIATDIRYNSHQKEICELLNIDLLLPYIECLSHDRLDIYRKAIHQ